MDWKAVRLVLGLLLLLMVPTELATAQRTEDSPSVLEARLRIATSFQSSGQYERAQRVLSTLYAEHPGNSRVADLLIESFVALKQYDEALGVIDERLSRTSSPLPLLLEKGRIAYLKGDVAMAEDAWSVAERQSPREVSIRSVYSAFVQMRLFERAIATLKRGQGVVDDPTSLMPELGYAYSLNGDHDLAMETYLALLREHPQQLGLVRNRLQPFVAQPEAMEASLAVAREARDAERDNVSVLELLAWLYAESSSFGDAIRVTSEIETLRPDGGQRLFTLAQQAERAGFATEALQAYGSLATRTGARTPAAEALLARADLWASLSSSHLEADSVRGLARAAYRQFLSTYANHRLRYEAQLHAARLAYHGDRDPDGAEALLQPLLEDAPAESAYDEARLLRAEIQLSRRQLDEADQTLAVLMATPVRPEQVDRARFERALIALYQGDDARALEWVGPLVASPQRDMANDALTLSLLLSEAAGPDTLKLALKLFGRGELERRTHAYEAAERTYASLIDAHGNHPLAASAYYHMASAMSAQGKLDEAVQAWRQVPLRYPQSGLADDALMEVAHMTRVDEQFRQPAMESLTQLLSQYPSSPRTEEARRLLRTYRGDTYVN